MLRPKTGPFGLSSPQRVTCLLCFATQCLLTSSVPRAESPTAQAVSPRLATYSRTGVVPDQSAHLEGSARNDLLKNGSTHIDSTRRELSWNRSEAGRHRRKAIEHLPRAPEELDGALWADGPGTTR